MGYEENLEKIKNDPKIKKLITEMRLLKAFEIAKKIKTFSDRRIFALVDMAININHNMDDWEEAIKNEDVAFNSKDNDQANLIAILRGYCDNYGRKEEGTKVLAFNCGDELSPWESGEYISAVKK